MDGVETSDNIAKALTYIYIISFNPNSCIVIIRGGPFLDTPNTLYNYRL